jgi:hypothetical protein
MVRLPLPPGKLVVASGRAGPRLPYVSRFHPEDSVNIINESACLRRQERPNKLAETTAFSRTLGCLLLILSLDSGPSLQCKAICPACTVDDP